MIETAWKPGARLALAATLVLALGCGSKETPAPAAPGDNQVKETGKQISKNPFTAAKQLAEAGKKMAEDAKKAEDRKPVDPVKFDVLLGYLPKGEGWKAEEPKGSTTQMGEWKITVVSNEYRRGGGEGDNPPPQQSMNVEITDGAYVGMVYAPFKMMAQFSNESTEGYQKGVTVEGNPGFEVWTKSSKSSELTILVADRYVVHLRGDQMEPKELREFLGQIKLADLAKLQ